MTARELIHGDICDLNFMWMRGWKKSPFIDDSMGYCYILLLRDKDENHEAFKNYKNEAEKCLSI